MTAGHHGLTPEARKVSPAEAGWGRGEKEPRGRSFLPALKGRVFTAAHSRGEADESA